MYHLHQSINTCRPCLETNVDSSKNINSLEDIRSTMLGNAQLEEIIVQEVGYQNFYLWYENSLLINDQNRSITLK